MKNICMGIAFILIMVPHLASADIALVKEDNNVVNISAGNETITTTTAENNLIVVFLAYYQQSGVMSVNDSQGNVYHSAANKFTLSPPAVSGQWFWAVAQSTGPLNVTGQSGGLYHSMRVVQYTGANNTNPIDWVGDNSSATSAAVNTNYTNDVILLAYHVEQVSTMAAPVGFSFVPNGALPAAVSGARRPVAQMNAMEIISGAKYTATRVDGNIYGVWGIALKPESIVGLRSQFTSNCTSGYNPRTLQFTDISAGNVTSWTWDFGDGNTSIEQNPTHTFYTGAYNVSLTINDGVTSNTSHAIINVLQDIDGIIFTTTDASFNPVIVIDTSLNPVIEWTFSDGSKSNSLNPIKIFESAAVRNQTLKVTPWNAVEAINLGYFAGDGGRYMPNTISTLEGCNVSAVYGLEKVAPSLKVFAASTRYGVDDNTISTLNFDNFTKLEFVECCYLRSLTNVSLHNMPSAQRLCFEQNNLTYLDLSDCPNLRDLRGANQQGGHRAVKYIWGNTGAHMYHLCIRDNYNLAEDLNYSQFPMLEELYIWNNNYYTTLNPVSTHLTQVRASGTHYTSANLDGKFPNLQPVGFVDLSNNELVSINVNHDPGIRLLNLSNNHLNQSEVDNVLLAIDSAGAPGTGCSINLNGNAYPSSNGVQSIHRLAAKGWTVTVVTPRNMGVLDKRVSTTSSGTLVDIANDSANVVNMTVTPSTGSVDVTVFRWDNNIRVWNESSEIHDTVALHILGDFPSDTRVQIRVDGQNETMLQSNQSGYISFGYTGYSEHAFEAIVLGPNDFDVSRHTASDTWIMIVSLIAVVVLIYPIGCTRGQSLESGELTNIMISVMALMLIVIIGYGLLSIL